MAIKTKFEFKNTKPPTVYNHIMEFVKICKRPYIAEDEDRWGQPLGTYSVYGSEVGFVEKNSWNDMVAFEHYGNTPESKAEQEKAEQDLKDGKTSKELQLPIMHRLLGIAKSTLWQFNMRVTELPNDDGEHEYVRSYASFGNPTLREWTPKHDEEVEKLKDKVKEMNKK